MYALVELGFILAKQEGNRDYGQVLLLKPIAVTAWLHAENKVSDEWRTSFVRRANNIGAKIPKTPARPAKAPTAK